MRLIIKNFSGNPAAFMRSKGYALDRRSFSEGGAQELSFVRRVTGQEFPRFHAYVKKSCFPIGKQLSEKKLGNKSPSPSSATGGRPACAEASAGKDLIINLHLDQKRPTYESGAAHAGEYGGELVKRESERLAC